MTPVRARTGAGEQPVADEPSYSFVLGSGCCGSSLVHEIVARHPDVSFMTNVDDLLAAPAGRAGLRRAGPDAYRRVPQEWTRKGRVRLAPSEGYRALAREVSPLVAFPDRALVAADADPWLAARLRGFFDSRAAARPGSRFVHKFTGHSRAGLLEAVLPGSRFVHVVRDGRAVAASLVRQGWWTTRGGQAESWAAGLDPQQRDTWERSGRSHPLLAGLAWQTMVRQHEAAREQGDAGRWLTLRYEDVLTDPVPVFARLLSHLGLDPAPRFDAALAGYRLDASRGDGYLRELGPATVAVLERHLGPELRLFGYDVREAEPTADR